MGLLSAGMLEAVTDKLAARAQAAVVTPATSMLTDNAENGLAQYIDANSEDPDLQAALLSAAAGCDRVALNGNLGRYLATALGQTTWGSLFTAANAYVRSAAGGGYETFGAYLAASGAELHPLASEIARIALGAGALVNGSAVVGAMHPLMNVASFDRVYTGAQGSLVDDTTDAASVATADVPIFAADDDVVALCSRSRFDTIMLELSTLASVDVGLHGYYWNGAAWAELTLTDSTTGMTENGGLITFDAPADWCPSNHDMQETAALLDGDAEEELYTVILQRTEDTVVTPPVATWIKLVPEAITNSEGYLFGVDQPPLAIVQITDTNECTVTPVQNAQFGRFVPPGTANSGLKLLAMTAIDANVTFTLGYVDQEGNAATKAQTAWTTPIAAGAEKVLALDSGDTGLRSVDADTCAITTTATSGVFAVVYSAYERTIGSK